MPAPEAILTLSNVVSGYGKMTILNGISASIRRGAITTVIGPNGAGKSTMFKTVFGLLGVRDGSIASDSSGKMLRPCGTTWSSAAWRSATGPGWRAVSRP